MPRLRNRRRLQRRLVGVLGVTVNFDPRRGSSPLGSPPSVSAGSFALPISFLAVNSEGSAPAPSAFRSGFRLTWVSADVPL